MSKAKFYFLLGYWAQVPLSFIESDIGQANMGLFVLSYGCDRDTWYQQLAWAQERAQAARSWTNSVMWAWPVAYFSMTAFLNVLQPCLNLLEHLGLSLQPRTPSSEYPDLPDDPADWF